ncbi:Glutaredoxin [Desulfocicer vacuolatum DSM 3385]|uniref:Glutaredoxin n=1 Tax=Desulfocicer vacuolatum DSM 3385 TaxID=1121400 RepID=A0A1W2E831_9BACT|nr:glutaredoxin [Desulfocicer vacuolatum]SMD05825.1 Glutaredoxin [Desulfocicer vacuolatum DSM 3385]
MAELKLYMTPTCPYCRKVLDFMKQNDITIPLADRDFSPENRQALIDIGGKPQVPCLIIDGTALYESDDIIGWLNENK